MGRSRRVLRAGILLAAIGVTRPAWALSFYVEPNNPWPAGWYDAAVANMQTVVNAYNAYGDFGNGSIYVYYNSGIPTAQSGYGGYNGSIGDGGTYPNVRVLLHESSHWLGTGTYSNYWQGGYAGALEQEFDGVGALLNGDSQHYWPYGENYDNESSPINDARHVAMVYALREDFGIGSTASPSSATAVTLSTSDAAGTSGFNYPFGWSDGHFPQQASSYSTGDNALRTPQGYLSWTFGGGSLTVNNRNNTTGGLVFNGWGTGDVVTIKNLIVDGGTVTHGQYPQDLFQLAGKVTLTSNGGTFNASQGNIQMLAAVGGAGGLTKTGPYTMTLNTTNAYSGATTVNAGTLKLGSVASSAIASYSFDNVSGSTVVNDGVGGSAMNGTLANGAAIVGGGKFGNAVSLANGASVDINNPIEDLANNGDWTISAWVKTTTAGSTILSKSNGTGWTNGNSVFYLGSGNGGGSGGVASAVRYAGGFYQAAPGATAVNDGNWHQVTYVDNGGSFAIYVDGGLQSLSSGNSGFGNGDIGSVVRLGATTDGGDGTANFNGLLDSVQLYAAPLTSQQVSTLYSGNTAYGSLPTNTPLTINSGAVLDLNGASQQVGALSGPVGSSIKLGTGQLTINSATNSQYLGAISGAGGSIVKQGAGTLTFGGAATYTGATLVVGGTLKLAPVNSTAVATYTFDNVSGSTVINDGVGGSAMNGILAGGATIVTGGKSGKAVSLAGGASVNINNPIEDLSATSSWTVSAWIKTTTAGASVLTKGDGSTWANGNTIFYLGSGNGGGTGGIASAVRYAGGFLQGAVGSTVVNDGAWHQVAYSDNGGTFSVYVDGTLQSLSSGNSAFGNGDVGSVVRLGVTTDTIAGDGTTNFNGLMDTVQFYPSALSAVQVSQIYQGLIAGPLPATTNVTIASGAALDLNGTVQQVASLTGITGSAVTLGSGTLVVNGTGSTTFAGAISGSGNLTKQGSSTLTLSGSNTYTGGTTLSAGTLSVTGSLASGTINVGSGAVFNASGIANDGLATTAALIGGGIIHLAGNTGMTGPAVLTVGSISVGSNSGSLITLGSSQSHNNRTLLVTGGLTFASTTAGQFDLADNDMIVRNGDLASLQAAIGRGYKFGTFGGPGLVSSAAAGDSHHLTTLGIIQNNQGGSALFTAGHPFDTATPADGDVLLKFTYFGDANLDGKVDGSDYSLIDAGYTTGKTGWFNGDFDYDGIVDGSDYTLIDNAFNNQSASLTPTAMVAAIAAEPAAGGVVASQAVPEPAIGGLLGMVGMTSLARRRRRKV